MKLNLSEPIVDFHGNPITLPAPPDQPNEQPKVFDTRVAILNLLNSITNIDNKQSAKLWMLANRLINANEYVSGDAEGNVVVDIDEDEKELILLAIKGNGVDYFSWIIGQLMEKISEE